MFIVHTELDWHYVDLRIGSDLNEPLNEVITVQIQDNNDLAVTNTRIRKYFPETWLWELFTLSERFVRTTNL